jgi:cytochrome c-type biogenesis protein CcmH/NrfF
MVLTPPRPTTHAVLWALFILCNDNGLMMMRRRRRRRRRKVRQEIAETT